MASAPPKADETNAPPSVEMPPAQIKGGERLTSPLITSISWGQIKIDGIGELKDAKVWPGGGRAWDWGETGTRHSPGIQVADVEELLEHGAKVVVLSRGMDQRLGVLDSVVKEIESRGVSVHVAETRAAVAFYNELTKEAAVGALFHSTC
ncbi:NADH dehydrogenase 1 alpha subcomplex assembly factor 3 [Podospora aff. communis PSN243]|uniref:Mth938 domain-containing protein n=1 Tax=Podospora aff. communis PSN243 TaxID=3040156 RepID=A0AAV9GEN2_9PEZI|nr:NADH dehydrogenase 1 alpha subcomplex assembly factor 3 [Podospora aff. communis PSN243]